jgi:hypothetical protein
MWEKLGDLPLHAFAVHAPVILVPLLAFVAVIYAVLPPIRRLTWWAVVGLAVAAPVSAFVAVQSGKALANIIGKTDEITRHQNFGQKTWYFSTALGVAALVLVALEMLPGRFRASAQTTTEATTENSTVVFQQNSTKWISVLLSVAIVVLAIFAMWYVVKTGDSGAHMRWSGVLPPD